MANRPGQEGTKPQGGEQIEKSNGTSAPPPPIRTDAGCHSKSNLSKRLKTACNLYLVLDRASPSHFLAHRGTISSGAQLRLRPQPSLGYPPPMWVGPGRDILLWSLPGSAGLRGITQRDLSLQPHPGLPFSLSPRSRQKEPWFCDPSMTFWSKAPLPGSGYSNAE